MPAKDWIQLQEQQIAKQIEENNSSNRTATASIN